MTNEEALRLIKSTDYCYVVWSTANQVIAVNSVPREATPDQILAAISKMDSGAMGRFLDPRTTTLATLEAEQRDGERISSRASIFRSWLTCSTEELLRMLEEGEFQPPMDRFHGPSHIIGQLYYSPDRALSKEQLGRLDAVAARRRGWLLEDRVLRDELECLLAVLSKDRGRLERLWSPGGNPGALRVSVGDLQLDNRPVVDDLVETVRRALLFGPRFDAMTALGKIGTTAGEDAASAIEEHIYESSEEVAALRRFSIQRIRTSASDWRSCPDCVRGKVPDNSQAIPSFKSCATCRGLSWTKPPVPSTQ